MAGGNVVVTTTVNKMVYETDNASYKKAVDKLKGIKKEWEKTGDAVNKKARQSGPGAAFAKSSNQMKMVNKRLNETMRKEEKKNTDHSIAMAKREARAKESLRRQGAARIKATMSQMTSKNPEMSKMRAYYKDMERQSKKAAKAGPAWGRGREFRLSDAIIGGAAVGATGSGGMVGTPKGSSNAALLRQQTLAMAGKGIKGQEPPKAPTKPSASQMAAEARNATAARRRQDTIGQQDVRLRSKYGAGYAGKLGGGGNGIAQLNKEFASGAISVGLYRANIASLERQFRSAQAGAFNLSSSLKGIRGALVGVTAAYGAFNSGAAVLKSGQFFQGLDATMTMVSDSPEEAAKRIQFVKDQSYRLGLDIEKAAQGYTQMSIAADGVLSKTQNDDLFKGFAEYSTALQVSPVKFERGITAIQQMMGKGTIMSEELKQQLAEGIPGSMQVFVKAAQKFFKDDKIGTKELLDLMQKGKLLAKDILPLVGEEYSKAANKGGALTKALASNRVAMQRLQQTWMLAQQQMFEGGFGDAMTETFNVLARLMSTNGGLMTSIGAFFGNVIDGFRDMATIIYDTFLFIGMVLEHYMKDWGIKGETLKSIFDWVAWGVGAVAFIGLMSRLLGILTAIAGLAGGLAAVKTAVTTGAITTGGSGGKPKGKGAGGWLGVAGSGLKGLGRILPVGAALATAWTATDMIGEATGLGSVSDSIGWWGDAIGGIGDSWTSARQAQEQKKLDYLNSNGLMPAGGPTTIGQRLGEVPVPKAEVTIKIDAGELSKMMESVVTESRFAEINMIIAGGAP